MPPKKKVNPKKKGKAVDLYASLTPEERLAQSADAKNRGNTAFAAKDFPVALEAFTEALALDPTNHVFFSNRSATYLQSAKVKEAVADAKKCITLKPDWGKGYSRLGAALFYRKDYDQAEDAYTKGIAVDPENAQLQQGLAQVHAAMKAGDMSTNTTATMLEKRREIEERVEQAQREQAVQAQRDAKANAQGNKSLNEGVSACIGIDLGTTYSCVGVWKDNTVEIIANNEGSRTTPSWVSFGGDERLVGDAAKSQAAGNPENTVFDVKRIIGQQFNDPKVQKDLKFFPFKVIEGSDGQPQVQVEFKGETTLYAPEQISSMVLVKMKEIAEAYLGVEVESAVVTVPAYFNDQQRQSTKDAASIAGLDCKRVINEPTAAALAYGLDRSNKLEAGVKSNVLIFDLGGGTFDVSILSISGGDEKVFEVQATGGDTHLGGEDFDNSMVTFLSEEFKRKHKLDVSSSARAVRRMRTACEKAKRMLSTGTTATIDLDSLVDGVDFSTTFTRAKFESLNAEHFGRCMSTVDAVMTDAKLAAADINDIVLVGGSTRIPQVQDMLRAKFDGQELCKNINPDEAVAYGAAVQGAILSGVVSDATNSLLLVDVTPLSMGIETTGRVMSTLIKRNTPIPVRKTKVYSTEEDYQTSVDVVVFEGERACTDGNNQLGEFRISGLERAKRGEPKVEVTFNIDANGILHVSAQDQKTLAKASTTISNNRGRLSQEQIDAMVADAEKFKDEDQARVEVIELRNEVEGMVYSGISSAVEVGNENAEEKLRDIQGWLDLNPQASLQELQGKQRRLERIFEKK
jgi:heat shock protein 1/8